MLPRVPMEENQPDPISRMRATHASVSTLLTAVGFGLWTPLYATVASTDWQGPVLFIAPIYGYAFCGFAIMPMANALLTQPFPHSAGLATGVQMQLQTLFGSIVSSVATATLPESGEPSNMLSLLVVCSVRALSRRLT